MRQLSLSAAFAAAVISLCTHAAEAPRAPHPAEPPLDTPLVVDPPVKVDVGDFKAQMLHVPEDKRAEFRTSYDRVASMVDNVYLAREIARKARAEGLDKDPVVQRRLEQVQEAFLADLYVENLDKQPLKGDMETRARELYEADPSKYLKPEAVHLQQMLIGLNGRTVEMARERAQQAYDEAKSGKESFEDLVGRYSDDPSKTTNGGDTGWVPLKRLQGPVGDAVKKLKEKGDVSPPIQTDRGFYILRLVERRKPEPMKFEEAKKGIIAEEEARLRAKRREDFVREIRSSPNVVVNTKNVEALVIPAEGILSAAAAEDRKLRQEQEAEAKKKAQGSAANPPAAGK